LSGLKAFQYSIEWLATEADIYCREAPPIIKTLGINALIVDQLSFGGGTVAEYLDIPFVSICSAVMFNQDIRVPLINTSWLYDPSWWGLLRNQVGYMLAYPLGQPIRKVINSYRRQWDLSPISNINDSFSPLAQISQQPAEFEFPRPGLPSCFHFVGYLDNPASRKPVSFPYEKLTGQPLIYASMGTLQNRLVWLFQMIAEACMGLDAQLVISLGGGADPESFPALPGNPLVVGYAPQLELLQRASLTITHAGMNTTLESLSNGVPMVAIPITNDQPGSGSRIAWTGTGEAIPLSKLSLEKLRKAISQVLTEDSYRENAARLQSAIKRAGGVRRAGDIIEQATVKENLPDQLPAVTPRISLS
ncbi:MAG: nucleotide disphospho-sugar-binding domain-containing protein, partial [Cyanobacteria bacterium J06643_13]